ncbi:MAG: hypothetical protein ACYDBJ_17600 [Aggregatilineales bacterium]
MQQYSTLLFCRAFVKPVTDFCNDFQRSVKIGDLFAAFGFQHVHQHVELLPFFLTFSGKLFVNLRAHPVFGESTP